MKNIIENRLSQQIDYIEGSTNIKKYSDKHKINITLRFSNSDDAAVLNRIKELSLMSIVI